MEFKLPNLILLSMAENNKTTSTNFGRQLRWWRKKRNVSQLKLATLAATTTRHLSFLETGRSRPGRDVILRLSRALDLPIRDVNKLMIAAGLRKEYAEEEFDSQKLEPYRSVIETMLDHHNPFPAVVLDNIGNILMTNEGYLAFMPTGIPNSPEESIDEMFNPAGQLAQFIENWDEIVWAWLDRQKSELELFHTPRLADLIIRAEKHLENLVRPETKTTQDAVLSPRFRVGDQIISTFATMMRFENVTEVTLSEIRVEFLFPMNAESRLFFTELHRKYETLPS